MPRRPREILPTGNYHAYVRGNRRQRIAMDDEDYALLKRLIGLTTRRCGWELQAFCLMPNHAHIQVRASHDQLSKGFHWALTCYAMAHNKRHGVDGHLFDGRFKIRHLATAEHLRDCGVYLALNPAKAGLCAHPVRWPWSSYGATIGFVQRPPFLSPLWLEDAFACRLPTAVRAYEWLVEQRLLGIASPDAA